MRQEGNMGCAVACVAAIARLSYKDSKRLFAGLPGDDHRRGYGRRAVALALSKAGLYYEFRRKVPTVPVFGIVYLRDEASWPNGHYLVRFPNGWMDPLRRDLRMRLPGKPRSFLVPA